MKLHLPKLLCAAVMTALAMPAMGADGPIKYNPSTGMPSTGIPYPNGKTYSTNLSDTDIHKVQQDNNGNTYLDVSYYGAYTEAYNWYGDLVIGSTAESQGYADNVGSFVDNWEWVTPTESDKTPHLQVHGNLTVQGNGKVVLGGKVVNDNRYTGIEAEGITVNGGSLTATKILANTLEVKEGTVSTSTAGCQKGQYYFTHGDYKLSSFSYIQNSLAISGGSLSFGYAGADIKDVDKSSNITTFFGSTKFSMTQTGGTMNVYGAINLGADATITQEGNAGTTVLRDTVFLQGTGSTKFNQSADKATLVIGRLERTFNSNYNIEFNQSGNGLIHLAYGSNFGKESTISLNQEGNGTINIGGGHDTDLTGELPTNYALDKVDTNASTTSFESVNTIYNITQSEKGGTINLKEGAAITAGTVSQTTSSAILQVEKNAKLTANEVEIQGTVNVNDGGTLAANSVTVGEGGKLVNNGALCGTLDTRLLAEGDVSTLAEGDDMLKLTITGGQVANYGTFAGEISIEGGILELLDGNVGDITMTGGEIIVHNESSTGSLTLNGGSITFVDGAVLNVADNALIDLSGTKVIVQLDSLDSLAVGEDFILFNQETSTVDLTDTIITFTDGTEFVDAIVSGSDGNTENGGKVTVNTILVPEPTTATLSLLALAALAARRRRK